MQVNSTNIQHLLYITVLGTRNTEINNITLDGDYLFTRLSIILEKICNCKDHTEEEAISLSGGLEVGIFHGEVHF